MGSYWLDVCNWRWDLHHVQGDVEADKKPSGLSTNFALYWDGNLFQELQDDTSITKYNENTGKVYPLKSFAGVHSNNGTKATPTLQADILGDWREEVLLPTTDDTELRVFSTTTPTNYRLYTLMQDPLYKNGIGWYF
ncbi:rhamnogalacturonan lyase family protein [Bacillus sp. OTU2372]|uniref:rhamnogalacturonan lyase family protein n=1 Tax=Bacillus sp. OTU2372 TaxID=3043858 RepID=UPI00313EDD23